MRRILALLLTAVMALSLVVVASATTVTKPGTVDLVITTAETGPEPDATELVYYVYLKPKGNAEVGAAQFTLTAPAGASFKDFKINKNYVYNNSGTGFGNENGIFALGMMTDGTSGEIGGQIEGSTFKAVLAGTVRETTGSLTKRMLTSSNCNEWLYEVTLKVPAFDGKTNYTLTVSDETAGFNAKSNETTDVSSVTVKHAVNVTSKGYGTGGVTVSGNAISWDNTDNAVYLLYSVTKPDADIKAEWKSGSYTGTVCSSKGNITANADGKRYDQMFTFTGVVSGEYKLAIFKAGKYVPKIVPITVGVENCILGEQKLWLYGDVTYDGKVNVTDAAQIQQYKASIKSKFDEGSEQDKADRMLAANVTEVKNGDNTINVTDAAQIKQYKAAIASAFDLMK